MQTPRLLPTDAELPHGTLVLGRIAPAEERALRQRLPESRDWRRAGTLSEALAEVNAGRVERLLFMQARPGELPPDAPQRLLATNPDLELLCVVGAWCEGELRTGQPWEGVRRAYWHQLGAVSPQQMPQAERPLAVVNARAYDNASAWIDALGELGCAAVWSTRAQAEPMHAGESLGIWDGAQLDGYEAGALAEFCRKRRASGAPVLAVFDFPRADAIAVARAIGATAVIGRPWTIEQVGLEVAALLAGQQRKLQTAASRLPLAA